MGIAQVLTQQIDTTTWQALGLVLTLVGLMVSFFVWRRSGAGRGLRAVALSLVPLAAGLIGLLELAWQILDSVLRWATRLVFSPVVWVGLVVAAVAALLYVAGTLLQRRSGKPTGRSGRRELTRQGERSDKPSTGKPAKDDQLIEDQDDIEAILRKHGIG